MNFRLWTEEKDQAEIDAFLGNSVIRTPVYHGTNNKFSKFEKRATQRFVLFSAFDVKAQGFFFSEDKETALSFGRNLITAYVRMTRPLLDPKVDKNLGIDRLPLQKEAHVGYILRHLIQRSPSYGTGMEIGVRWNPVPNRKDDAKRWADDLESMSDERKAYAASYQARFGHSYEPPKKSRTGDYEWIYNAIGSGGIHWDVLDNPNVVNSMKKLGYDGTFVDEDNSSWKSVFVPEADQILII